MLFLSYFGFYLTSHKYYHNDPSRTKYKTDEECYRKLGNTPQLTVDLPPFLASSVYLPVLFKNVQINTYLRKCLLKGWLAFWYAQIEDKPTPLSIKFGSISLAFLITLLTIIFYCKLDWFYKSSLGEVLQIKNLILLGHI